MFELKCMQKAALCSPCPHGAAEHQLLFIAVGETIALAPAVVPWGYKWCDGSPSPQLHESPITLGWGQLLSLLAKPQGPRPVVARGLGVLKPSWAAVWKEPPSATSSADATPLYFRSS